VRVTPKPATPPLMLVGGSTPKAAKRAARLGCGFFPAVGDPELERIYLEACAAAGTTGFVIMPGGPGFVHVTHDPEGDWTRIAPFALHDARTYHEWQPAGQRSEVHVAALTQDDVRRSSVYRVVTPDGCLAIAREHGRILLHPLMGGIDPELGWASLRLFAETVLPQLR